MTISTIAVTGGNGKIGLAILEHLADHGYETANISRGKCREEISDTYVTTDLLDAGETYGAIAKTDADAVIHMGTIPDPYSNPDYRVYESNVMAAKYVLEAADALGLESVCLPSSINAIGSEHQERNTDIRWLPVDESHPRTPDDSYGIAKYAMEVTADGVGRRPSTNLTIASLRYPWVMTDEEMCEYLVEADRSLDRLADVHPSTGREVLFSYLAVDDAATIARKAVEADFNGHEVFWAVAGDTTAAAPTANLAAEYYPSAEAHKEFHGHEALIDLSKASKVLNWEPQHSWRDL
ncbi:NAD-dependent epimerase/dehydratase family protein [Natrarchaeobius oligotrophus]|uniref:NAD(P)-dependent oxidoreductase n=1 Tax=Natrarchaeobius chitinivorans TaxID=1679083 RepID=A0A3N6P9M6_NATCH|nr:NAD(P)-dependent oxidoreductase [Natrarchaeobius chitinivorans]RQG95629.1 NAD(P)-dependent oxidoreductase [Natrarchaeobius chitinivorans]